MLGRDTKEDCFDKLINNHPLSTGSPSLVWIKEKLDTNKHKLRCKLLLWSHIFMLKFFQKYFCEM